MNFFQAMLERLELIRSPGTKAACAEQKDSPTDDLKARDPAPIWLPEGLAQPAVACSIELRCAGSAGVLMVLDN